MRPQRSRVVTEALTPLPARNHCTADPRGHRSSTPSIPRKVTQVPPGTGRPQKILGPIRTSPAVTRWVLPHTHHQHPPKPQLSSTPTAGPEALRARQEGSPGSQWKCTLCPKPRPTAQATHSESGLVTWYSALGRLAGMPVVGLGCYGVWGSVLGLAVYPKQAPRPSPHQPRLRIPGDVCETPGTQKLDKDSRTARF